MIILAITACCLSTILVMSAMWGVWQWWVWALDCLSPRRGLVVRPPPGPWPATLILDGDKIDLSNGVFHHRQGRLDPEALRLLRALAARPGWPRRQAFLHELVMDGTGAPEAIDAVATRLVCALGTAGHHIEPIGHSSWQLWEGPE